MIHPRARASNIALYQMIQSSDSPARERGKLNSFKGSPRAIRHKVDDIRDGSKNPLDFRDGLGILKLRKFLPEGHRYGFCCFSKPYLVMESATRKGREVRKSLRNSMAFLFGGEKMNRKEFDKMMREANKKAMDMDLKDFKKAILKRIGTIEGEMYYVRQLIGANYAAVRAKRKSYTKILKLTIHTKKQLEKDRQWRKDHPA